MDNRNMRAFTVILFPIVLAVGILLIPVVSDYNNHAIAAAAVEKTGRWFAGHLVAAVAFGLSILSANAVNAFLKDIGHQTPGFILPIMAIGAGLYAAGLGADGIGPIAVKSLGYSPALFFDGSGWWVSGTFVAATLLFGVGLIGLVAHANQSQMMVGIWRYVIFISALLFVTVPAIPSGWGLYGEALAAFGVFAPLGVAIWRSG